MPFYLSSLLPVFQCFILNPGVLTNWLNLKPHYGQEKGVIKIFNVCSISQTNAITQRFGRTRGVKAAMPARLGPYKTGSILAVLPSLHASTLRKFNSHEQLCADVAEVRAACSFHGCRIWIFCGRLWSVQGLLSKAIPSTGWVQNDWISQDEQNHDLEAGYNLWQPALLHRFVSGKYHPIGSLEGSNISFLRRTTWFMDIEICFPRHECIKKCSKGYKWSLFAESINYGMLFSFSSIKLRQLRERIEVYLMIVISHAVLLMGFAP